MSATPAKFTFDLDMGKTQRNSRTLSEDSIKAMLDTARAEGYAQGLGDGEQSVVSQAAKSLTASAQAIGQKAAQLIGVIDKMEKELRADAVKLASSVGRKLATHSITRQPETELEQLLEECLVSLENTPHLVIRCHPQLVEKLQEIATPLVTASGYSGRLIVMGDPDIPLGDGRMEWADGGLVRDSNQINERIDDNINAYLDACGIAPITEA
jgi:flagellar assembly protein FliH